MKPRSEAVSGTEEMTQHGAHRTVEGERRVLGKGSAPDPSRTLPRQGRQDPNGRPRSLRRDDLRALRTGIQWNALPREMGASSTVHDRYQEWERLGFFEELWRAGLLEYDELEGIEWEWQAIDGAMTKSPLGRGATGKNPTDRAKMGTKRSMLTDGAGIPLAVAVEGANRHDSRLLVATLDGLVVARPAPEGEEDCPEQHLCLGTRRTTRSRCAKS